MGNDELGASAARGLRSAVVHDPMLELATKPLDHSISEFQPSINWRNHR
jgi:hypothetical protein